MFMAALFTTGKEGRASCIHLYMNTERGVDTISTKKEGNPATDYKDGR